MKQRSYLSLLLLILVGMNSLITVEIMGQTLRHAYDFKTEGMASDRIGEAHGVLHTEGASVTGGNLILSGGHVSLPGSVINLPQYDEITIEAVFTQQNRLSEKNGHPALWSFGTIYTGGFFPVGSDYLIFMPFHGNGSTFQISCLEYLTPWAGPKVNGQSITETKKHHVVCCLKPSLLEMYQDGVYASTVDLNGNHQAINLSTDSALIGASLFNDPNWQGTLHEFNIYEGGMDSASAVSRASAFLEGNSASLWKLCINGNPIPDFSPLKTTYEFSIELGAELPVVSAAGIDMDATISITQATTIPGRVTVEVVGKDGSELTYEVVFTEKTSVGVGKLYHNASNIDVYPRISKGVFIIKLNGKQSRVRVFNLNGNLISQAIYNSMEEIVKVPYKGMYFIHVEQEGKVKVFNVINQ